MLQFLLPLLAAGAGAGIGMATSSGKKGSRGRGAWKGALAGGALGLGGLGLSGALRAAPIAASGGKSAMSLVGGGVGNSAGTPIASSGIMGKLGGFLQNDQGKNMLMQGMKQQGVNSLLSGIMGEDEQSMPGISEPIASPQSNSYQATIAPTVNIGKNLSPYEKEELLKRYRDGIQALGGI